MEATAEKEALKGGEFLVKDTPAEEIFIQQ